MIARIRPWVAAAAIAGVALLPGPGRAASAPPAERPLRVVFVGNSQTATNDLPAFVAEIAKATNGRRVEYVTFAPSAVTLQGNWYLGSGARALLTRRWDAVVFQQGPSVLPGARERLCTYGKLFADEARAAGTRPYLMMVWPRRGSPFG